jgi:RNA polymerase sigma factor (sigma-70 family)
VRRATPVDLAGVSDERLALRAGAGDPRALERLFERHHAALLGFCRHVLGSREEGEDALQQTFLRAVEALRRGAAPDHVRAWLFTIARNRCLTMLAARRSEAELPAFELAGSPGVAEEVDRRDELRELLADVARLPEEQRSALVLAELGDLPQAQIADVLGVAEARVKALIYQARQTLIAERVARTAGCDEVRAELAAARGPALRRGWLRRHVRRCPGCQAFREEVALQRACLAVVLPVVAGEGLRSQVLGAAGAALGSGGAGLAVTTGVGAGGGIAAKAAAVAVTAAVVTGGGVVASHDATSRSTSSRQVAPATATRNAAQPIGTASPEGRAETIAIVTRPGRERATGDAPLAPGRGHSKGRARAGDSRGAAAGHARSAGHGVAKGHRGATTAPRGRARHVAAQGHPVQAQGRAPGRPATRPAGGRRLGPLPKSAPAVAVEALTPRRGPERGVAAGNARVSGAARVVPPGHAKP